MHLKVRSLAPMNGDGSQFHLSKEKCTFYLKILFNREKISVTQTLKEQSLFFGKVSVLLISMQIIKDITIIYFKSNKMHITTKE